MKSLHISLSNSTLKEWKERLTSSERSEGESANPGAAIRFVLISRDSWAQVQCQHLQTATNAI